MLRRGLIIMLTCFCAAAAKAILQDCMPAAAAKRLLDKMNRNVNPCDDFYQYSCGGFIDNSEIPVDSYEASTYQYQIDTTTQRLIKLLSKRIRWRDAKTMKKAKLFYQSCLDQDEIEANAVSQVLEFLNSEGTWPTFDSSWNEGEFDLERSMAAANRLYTQEAFNPGPLISTVVFKDVLGDGFRMYLFYVDFQSGIGTKEYIVDMLKLLGADSVTAEADAQAMIDLNEQLSQLPNVGIGLTQVGTLASIPGTFDWLKYLNEVFRDTNYTVKGTDNIYIVPSYYSQVIQVLNAASQRTLANLIKWRMFLHLIQAMPEAFLSRHFEASRVFLGIQELGRRDKFCAKVVNGDLGNFGMSQATARMLIQRYYRRRDKTENDRQTEVLVETFADILQNNEWLSAETKQFMISKIKTVRHDRVYPDTTFNNRYLRCFYRDFDIQGTGYAKNFINSILGNTRRSLEQIIRPERYRWNIAASIVNAYADYITPLTVSTAAFLKEPVFDLSFPSAAQYGSGGFISGHELSHLLGTNGIYWSELGTINPSDDYLSQASNPLYFEKLSCLIDQYNQYVIPNTPGMTVQGDVTLEENYADNVGLKIAYHSFDKVLKEEGEQSIKNIPFSARELFFVSFAQTFCEKMTPQYAFIVALYSSYSSGNWRINGPLRNLPEFAETFNCPANSMMNPTERCVIY